VEAEGIKAGEYIAATEFKVFINVNELDVKLCTEQPPVADENAQPGDPVISDNNGTSPRPELRVRMTPPPPHTTISGIVAPSKFRPGQTVVLNVQFNNTDSAHDDFDGVHHGTFTDLHGPRKTKQFTLASLLPSCKLHVSSRTQRFPTRLN